MHVHEVYFRCFAPEDGTPPVYHVLLADKTKDAFGDVKETVYGPYTPTQARDKGYDLSTILSGVNTATIAETDDLRRRVDELATECEILHKRVEELTAQVNELQAAAQVTPAVDAEVAEQTKP